MAVSRLLKSCATPPANCPIASILCDWRNCSSSARCSVMSLVTARIQSSPCSSMISAETMKVRVLPCLHGTLISRSRTERSALSFSRNCVSSSESAQRVSSFAASDYCFALVTIKIEKALIHVDNSHIAERGQTHRQWSEIEGFREPLFGHPQLL